MHILNAFRIRVVIFVLVLLILWQIFRNWPEENNYNQHEKFTRPSGAPVVAVIYYEALCPDSKHFILRQLVPAYYRVPQLIDFYLVPYGKATTNTNADGSLSFDCQHGPTECTANTYHACTIEAIQEPKVVLDMISCMIKDNYRPKEAMIACAKSNHIDYEPIQKCFDSPHGAELLKLHGEATNALQPPMTFVPTITLDGQQRRQASILKDFFGAVCDIASGYGPKPDACS